MESKLAKDARAELTARTRKMSAEERLTAFHQHCQLMTVLAARGRPPRHPATRTDRETDSARTVGASVARRSGNTGIGER